LVAYETGLLKRLRIVDVAFDRVTVTQRQVKQSPVEKRMLLTARIAESTQSAA